MRIMRNLLRGVFGLVILSTVFGIIGPTAASPTPSVKPPNLAGKRVLWLGDSITQAGTYVSFVEYYLNKRFPTQNFDFIAVGLASETVSGLTEKDHPFPRPNLFERLPRALEAVRPDVVVACYGMNDGIYHPQSGERRKAFEDGIRKLQEAVRARGATLILLTPPPFDPLPVASRQKAGAPDFSYKAPFEGYDNVLAEYAAWEKTLAAPDVLVVDLHTSLLDYITARRRTEPNFTFARDGIHPDEIGHLLIANTILDALGVQPPVTERTPGDAQLQAIRADPLWEPVHKHRETRSEGWLSYIGYTREKAVKTNVIQPTEGAATPLQVRVDNLRRITRVACIGDSITAGVGTAPPVGSYPDQLQRLLGDRWEIRNFGVSGATLLRSGDKPYQKEAALKKALEYKPDVVIILLGTNDSKPQNWAFQAQFAADYRDLITQFKRLETCPRLFVCSPPFVSGGGNFGINEPAVLEEIPRIRTLAEAENVTFVDVHAAMVGQDFLFPDRVHPNNAGAGVIAKTVYTALTGAIDTPNPTGTNL